MVDVPSLGLVQQAQVELLGLCDRLEWAGLSSPGAWTRLSSPRKLSGPSPVEGLSARLSLAETRIE